MRTQFRALSPGSLEPDAGIPIRQMDATTALMAWWKSADPASGIRDERNIQGRLFEPPRLHISTDKKLATAESELSDRLSGGVIQRLGTRVRFPGRMLSAFGFLAHFDLRG